jgi:putative transcriptional regulator
LDTPAYDALLLDHATGARTPARRLLVETHLRLRPAARARLSSVEAAGGAMLEGLTPEAVATPLRIDARPLDRSPDDDGFREARALVAAAAHGEPDNLNWRWRAPSMRELRLPVAGASLLRLGGGHAAPMHGHTGEELTLVLRGAYADATGVYAPGDIAFADAGLDHAPYVPEGDACVCLVATEGALRFHDIVARIANRIFS